MAPLGGFSPISPVSAVVDHARCYHLVSVRPQPSFDTQRAVKRMLVAAPVVQRVNRLMHRHASVISLAYFVGLAYRLYAMVASSPRHGPWLIVLSALLQFPAVVFTLLSLNLDFAVHMTRTFDFWFFAVSNCLCHVCLSLAYQDARVILAVVSWLEIENVQFADALLAGNTMPFIVAVSAVGVVFFYCLAVMIQVDATPIHRIVWWRTPRGLVLRNEDVLINAMMTVAVLMARLSVRKRNALRRTKTAAAVACVGYRCWLKFQTGVPSRLPAPSGRDLDSLRLSTVRLEPVVHMRVFKADDTMVSSPRFSARCFRPLWTVVFLTGLACSVASLVVDPAMAPTAFSTAVSIAALGLHALGAAPFILLHQRQLLRRLLVHFDTLFLIIQGTLAELAACHLFQWRVEPCSAIACLWLWLYVVATADALTPSAKRTLGFSSRVQAWLVLMLLVLQGVLVLELAVVGRWEIVDRVVVTFSVPFNREHPPVAVFAMPFLFSRLLTTVVWTAHILVRLCLAATEFEELTSLRGNVQYEPAIRQSQATGPTPASINSAVTSSTRPTSS